MQFVGLYYTILLQCAVHKTYNSVGCKYMEHYVGACHSVM